jgi:hypothetical protein
VDTERNLLFGLLAVQLELIDHWQFIEACTARASRKDVSVADILLERGWLSAKDCAIVQALLERKLAKHQNDARIALAADAEQVPKYRDTGALVLMKLGVVHQLAEDFDLAAARFHEAELAFEALQQLAPDGYQRRYLEGLAKARSLLGQVQQQNITYARAGFNRHPHPAATNPEALTDRNPR